MHEVVAKFAELSERLEKVRKEMGTTIETLRQILEEDKKALDPAE
jgi:predicted transcriptional regulator